jgi:DNA-binding CsgD family transcriptional regulator
VIPAEAYWWATADPSTYLFTSAESAEIPERAGALFLENELRQGDVNAFVHLARDREPVQSLYRATAGHPDASPRFRDILRPLGMGDELRAALRDDGACWGFLCLHRGSDAPSFTDAEIADLDRLSRHLAGALRNAQLAERARPNADSPDSGVVLVNDRLEVTGLTPGAEAWFAELDGGSDGRPPLALSAVVGRLLGLEDSSAPAVSSGLPPRARVQTRSGRWLTFHASRVADQAQHGMIAVMIEAARPPETTPLLFAAHELTERESAVARCVLRGLSNKEIAAALGMKPLTAQQHLKAVFEKLGVHSRGELIGRILADATQ